MSQRTVDAVTELILETFRLNGALIAAGDRLVADIGLTSARWQVLGGLALSPVPLPVAHVARNMGLSRQAVQRLVNEMETDGLVRFAPNPHHRRAQLVLLTERGEKVYRAASERQQPWAVGLARGLTGRDLAQALAVLRTLRSHAEVPDNQSSQEEN